MLALVGFVGLSLLVVAATAALAESDGLAWLRTQHGPPATPPPWLCLPVWTAVSALIGVAAWLVWKRIDVGVRRKRAALRIWGWQLLLSALWAAALFGAHSPGLALVVMAILLPGVVVTILAFLHLQPRAGLLLLPYAAWLLCIAYVNAGFWWLGAV